MDSLSRRLIWVLWVLAACRQEASPAPSELKRPSWGEGELPSRAEVVAEADRLAVQGQRTGGEAGRALLASAAQLRERIWRLEGREPDALEAAELHGLAQKIPGPSSCQHELQQALLRGELTKKASAAYEVAYLVREAYRDQPVCVEQANAALTTLAAFKAMPERLLELERDARKRRGEVVSETALPTRPTSRVVAPPQQVIAFAGASRITQIERYPGKDAARIVVFLTAPASFQVGQVAGDAKTKPRFFVDIAGAEYSGATQIAVGGIVEQVRLGRRDTGTRLVLDLADAISEQVFYLPEPFRLVIDVSRKGSSAVREEPSRVIQRVVLDPGHGGHDPGATGAQGLREKDVVLDIAHRAAPLIARELGISTLLTRDLDAYVPLDERVARANAFAADLFISIHCNASETHASRGVMTFVLDVAGDAGASHVAARENASSLAASAEFASAMRLMADARMSAASLHFAELVQRASMAAVQTRYADVRDGGVQRAGFYVLAGARMPAVLFEASFISHPGDELRLNTPDYRQKLADGLVNAVRAYREGL